MKRFKNIMYIILVILVIAVVDAYLQPKSQETNTQSTINPTFRFDSVSGYYVQYK